MMTRWPNREEREAFEITGFIEAYSRLPGSVQLEVVKTGDKPDYIVRDPRTRQEYGVELTVPAAPARVRRAGLGVMAWGRGAGAGERGRGGR